MTGFPSQESAASRAEATALASSHFVCSLFRRLNWRFQRAAEINRAIAFAPAAPPFIRFVVPGIRRMTADTLADESVVAAVKIERHDPDRILAPLPTISLNCLYL